MDCKNDVKSEKNRISNASLPIIVLLLDSSDVEALIDLFPSRLIFLNI